MSEQQREFIGKEQPEDFLVIVRVKGAAPDLRGGMPVAEAIERAVRAAVAAEKVRWVRLQSCGPKNDGTPHGKLVKAVVEGQYRAAQDILSGEYGEDGTFWTAPVYEGVPGLERSSIKAAEADQKAAPGKHGPVKRVQRAK